MNDDRLEIADIALDAIALCYANGNRCRHRAAKNRLFWHFYATSDNSIKNPAAAANFLKAVKVFGNTSGYQITHRLKNNVVMVKVIS